MHKCQFHPTHTFNVVCGNPATRQVYFPEGAGDGYYIYICDECLAFAVDYWKEGGFKVEF